MIRFLALVALVAATVWYWRRPWLRDGRWDETPASWESRWQR